MTDIERVGVVGCGQMGAGIAEVCARSGLDVKVAETTGEALEIGRTRLFNSLSKAAERGKISDEELEATQARLTFTTDLGEFADRDLVIEAVVENEQVKTEIFQVLDQVVTRPDAILASNTSSIPLVKLAVATSRPDHVIGIHFFNPAPVQKLVELIPALTTSEGTLSRAQVFTEKVLGKHAIRAQDRSGFVVNALLIPYLLSAIRMFESGIASREDIDNGMEMGCAHPMGPLKLSDLIGLDTVASVAYSMYEEYKEPCTPRRRCSSAWSTRAVSAGRRGRASTATTDGPDVGSSAGPWPVVRPGARRVRAERPPAVREQGAQRRGAGGAPDQGEQGRDVRVGDDVGGEAVAVGGRHRLAEDGDAQAAGGEAATPPGSPRSTRRTRCWPIRPAS